MDHEKTVCPDSSTLAACFEGSLTQAEQNSLRPHLSACRDCRNQLALLSRLATAEITDSPSELTLQRVQCLSGRNRGTPLRKAPVWATAAVMLLALGLVWQWFPDRSELDQPGKQVRTVSPAETAPRPLVLNASTTSPDRALQIKWTPVETALYYEVSLVSKRGDLLVKQRVEGNELTLQRPFSTDDESDLYVRVDAFLSGSRKLNSSHVLVPLTEVR